MSVTKHPYEPDWQIPLGVRAIGQRIDVTLLLHETLDNKARIVVDESSYVHVSILKRQRFYRSFQFHTP